MLGMIAGGESQQRPEQTMRYSVKCDRETAAAIRRAASRAGMSETAFVQAHFNSILASRGASAAAQPAAPAGRDNGRDARSGLRASPGTGGSEAEATGRLSAGAKAGLPRPGDTQRASDLGISEPALRLWRVATVWAGTDGVFDLNTRAYGDAAIVSTGAVPRAVSMLVTRGLVERLSVATPNSRARFRLIEKEA